MGVDSERGRVRAVALFDLDGTLIDTERRNRMIWQMLLDNHQLDHDVAIFMGRRGRDVLPEIFPDHDVEQLIAEVFSYDDHPGLPDVAPVPGAAELVRKVAAYGSRIGLVTSARREWAETRLDQVGVRSLFEVLVTAEDVEVGKPDPAGFLLAAARLRVDPDDCVVFEDSVAGISAAKAAGMKCVAVATTHAGEDLADADLVVADLTAVGWPPFS
ncbi:HAD family hydrolase [Nonomuraea recticatena]|uniref:HAD family hydrolase n=1 Tax=Nonomuraea recticatena TaxID=46178 RepID=A0ABP6DH21_9ACTN